MRKVSEQARNAFISGNSWAGGNTSVRVENGVVILSLHGNDIARRTGGRIEITTAGWDTHTTKERLNAIPAVSVRTIKGELYLNGKPWNGEWTITN